MHAPTPVREVPTRISLWVKQRRRAASRRLLRPTDVALQKKAAHEKEAVLSPEQQVLQAEPVLPVGDTQAALGEAEKSWCRWTCELICRICRAISRS